MLKEYEREIKKDQYWTLEAQLTPKNQIGIQTKRIRKSSTNNEATKVHHSMLKQT